MEDKIINIEYDNKNVQEIFEDLNNVQQSKKLMIKKIGFDLTKSVKRKYNQILAFSNVLKLIESKIGKPELLSGDLCDYYSLHLSANYRLVFKPNTFDYNNESLSLCDTITIKGVVDYHGKGQKNSWIIS